MHFWRFDTTWETALENETHSMEVEGIKPIHVTLLEDHKCLFGKYIYFQFFANNSQSSLFCSPN